jgi:hypothetical protein
MENLTFTPEETGCTIAYKLAFFYENSKFETIIDGSNFNSEWVLIDDLDKVILEGAGILRKKIDPSLNITTDYTLLDEGQTLELKITLEFQAAKLKRRTENSTILLQKKQDDSIVLTEKVLMMMHKEKKESDAHKKIIQDTLQKEILEIKNTIASISSNFDSSILQTVRDLERKVQENADVAKSNYDAYLDLLEKSQQQNTLRFDKIESAQLKLQAENKALRMSFDTLQEKTELQINKCIDRIDCEVAKTKKQISDECNTVAQSHASHFSSTNDERIRKLEQKQTDHASEIQQLLRKYATVEALEALEKRRNEASSSDDEKTKKTKTPTRVRTPAETLQNTPTKRRNTISPEKQSTPTNKRPPPPPPVPTNPSITHREQNLRDLNAYIVDPQ